MSNFGIKVCDRIVNLYSKTPNFSIVLPCSCNANCYFCSWKKVRRNTHIKVFPNKPTSEHITQYETKLKHVLDNLPKEFTQISLTGGEPLRSPYLGVVLKMIDKTKFTKVVLTTNGGNRKNFLNKFPQHFNKINHINLSRHSHDEITNNKIIFNSKNILSNNEVKLFCEYMNKNGIDVTLNCVLTRALETHKSVLDYINFAKEVNASAICFRKIYDNNLSPTYTEKLFDNIKFKANSCHVCRTKTQLINGMFVHWKISAEEPTLLLQDTPAVIINGTKLKMPAFNITKNIYELIFQPDGNITVDWKGQFPASLVQLDPNPIDDCTVTEDVCAPQRNRNCL